MPFALGTSIVGRQEMLSGIPQNTTVHVLVNAPFPPEPRRMGYIEILENISAEVYHQSGDSLWYQGIALRTGSSQSGFHTVVGWWREAGIDWEIYY